VWLVLVAFVQTIFSTDVNVGALLRHTIVQVCGTGGGARKYKEKIKEMLNIQIMHCDESVATGLLVASHAIMHIPDTLQ
jgi:pantothenate kinase